MLHFARVSLFFILLPFIFISIHKANYPAAAYFAIYYVALAIMLESLGKVWLKYEKRKRKKRKNRKK